MAPVTTSPSSQCHFFWGSRSSRVQLAVQHWCMAEFSMWEGAVWTGSGWGRGSLEIQEWRLQRNHCSLLWVRFVYWHQNSRNVNKVLTFHLHRGSSAPAVWWSRSYSGRCVCVCLYVFVSVLEKWVFSCLCARALVAAAVAFLEEEERSLLRRAQQDGDLVLVSDPDLKQWHRHRYEEPWQRTCVPFVRLLYKVDSRHFLAFHGKNDSSSHCNSVTTDSFIEENEPTSSRDMKNTAELWNSMAWNCWSSRLRMCRGGGWMKEPGNEPSHDKSRASPSGLLA